MKNNMGTIIFTDGSSLGNPGPGGYGALIVFPGGEVRELGGREEKTTNNRMEMLALLRAFEYVSEHSKTGEVKIYADSKYVIQGITGWVYGWEKNGWKTKGKTEVMNRDLWELLVEAKRAVEKHHQIVFEHVPGHVDIPGNERVDTIAREFAEGVDVPLFCGTLSDYFLSRDDLHVSESILEEGKKKRKQKKGKALSYLSLVGGVPERHQTWAQCQARVSGKSGARYKKALSKEDEKNILREWGFTLEDL